MITKNTFVEIMNTLRDYYDGLSKFENSLDTVFENNWLINVLDAVLNALFNELEADNNGDSLIYAFAFSCDWGRDEDAICTTEELYDLLTEVKEKRNER